MFEVRIEATFHARHAVRGRDGRMEEPHWHAWRVEAIWEGRRLDDDGFLVDFLEVQDHLAGVLAPLEGTDLNGHAVLDGRSPSTEAIARILFDGLAPRPCGAGVRLAALVLHEAPGCSVTYRPEPGGPG